jgi:MoaA/NifB/PqqE/SkfB family radical SAM enzyme
MRWDKAFRKLQVDITSYCNAKCGACARNVGGGETVDWLKLEHFDIDIWNRLVSEDINGTCLEKLTLNGNWGDPGMHPQLPVMMETFINHHPECNIFIATNGSMQSPDWWEKLGSILYNSANHLVQFAVDGLEDTHSIYRRNTNFLRIKENIRAFAKTGRAQIIYTMFDHNVHQIEEAKQLAIELGCASFRTRLSHASRIHIETSEEDYLITTSNTSRELIQNVSLPASDLKPTGLIKGRVFETNTNDTDCPWYNNGEIQIDPWGNVWPCCHISMWAPGIKHPSKTIDFDIESIQNKYGNFNNLKEKTLMEILLHTWYNNDIPDAVNNASWSVCKKTCDVGCKK